MFPGVEGKGSVRHQLDGRALGFKAVLLGRFPGKHRMLICQIFCLGYAKDSNSFCLKGFMTESATAVNDADPSFAECPVAGGLPWGWACLLLPDLDLAGGGALSQGLLQALVQRAPDSRQECERFSPRPSPGSPPPLLSCSCAARALVPVALGFFLPELSLALRP